MRRGVSEIFKIQGITVLVLLLAGPRLLDYVGISPLCTCSSSRSTWSASAMQVLMLAVFNVLFYLDERRAMLSLSALFVAINVVLTIALAGGGAGVLRLRVRAVDGGDQHRGLLVTSRKLDRLEMHTFMRVE